MVLAAQRNNYEILKMLLDRGATIPMPHDVKCSCEECVDSSSDDSLRFSLARINSYKVLHIFIAPIHIEFIELNCKEAKFMYTQLCRPCQCCFWDFHINLFDRKIFLPIGAYNFGWKLLKLLIIVNYRVDYFGWKPLF